MALLAAPAAAQTGSVDDLRWMSGRWLSCDDGREVGEHWFGGRSGELYGASYTRGEGFEFMRIGVNASGAVAYFAQPMGRPPTEFPLAHVEARSVTFENPAHDFPQRIIYRRAGDRLHARIEGVQDGAPLAYEWSYRRVSHDNGCPAG